MPRKEIDSAEQAPEMVEKPVEQVVEAIPEPTPEQKPVLKAFMFPSIGNGVTIMATDQADADAQAAVHPLRIAS